MAYLRSAALPGALLALSVSAIASPLVVSLSISVLGALMTYRAIPLVSEAFIANGMFGKDQLKKKKNVVPEGVGAIVGAVYFIIMVIFIPVPFVEWLQRGTYIEGQHPPFPHYRLAQYLGGLLSLFGMLFLGFVDDVFDIPWRVKIWFPLASSLPLMMVYFATQGITYVLVPLPLQFLFKFSSIDLGIFYYAFMAALCVFSTNAINILAGANGVEGSQSLVIAASLAVNDVLQMNMNPARVEAHRTSLYFLLPFIGVTVGYLGHNWYPARAFGGDTFAYFSGMIFAVVGILGHLSKTVLLFMAPQIFNFLYSCPQLFKFVECPRHRMPVYDSKTDTVSESRFSFRNSKYLGRLMIRFLELFRLVDVERDKDTGEMLTCSNLTLMNLVLIKMGPLREPTLVICVVFIQIVSSLIAFFIRYGVVHYFYHV